MIDSEARVAVQEAGTSLVGNKRVVVVVSSHVGHMWGAWRPSSAPWGTEKKRGISMFAEKGLALCFYVRPVFCLSP